MSSKVRKDFGAISINSNKLTIKDNLLVLNDAPLQISNSDNNVVSTRNLSLLKNNYSITHLSLKL